MITSPITKTLTALLPFLAFASPADATLRVVYPSSIDAGVNLSGFLYYPASGRDMPIVVAMHGYAGRAVNINPILGEYLAEGFGRAMVLVPDMRGVGYSEGVFDSGGRELQDIIDMIEWVKTNYPAYVDPDKIHLLGWSGGGGNAFGVAARYPDYFNSIAAYFGISDYGHDLTDGWYYNGATGAHQTLMQNPGAMGGIPEAVPNNYLSRKYVDAIKNYTGGHLWIYHDTGDPTVPVINSQNAAAALAAAGNTNYNYYETGPVDDPRWTHGLPLPGNDLWLSLPTVMNPVIANTYPAWTVPASGTLQAAGYIDTKRYSLWLGTGKTEYAEFAYNVTTKVFTVTSSTGAYTFEFKLKGQTPLSEVNITFNGGALSETADADGVATFTGSGS